MTLARKNKIPVIHVVHHGPPGAGFFDPQGMNNERKRNKKKDKKKNEVNITIKHKEMKLTF